MEDLEIYITREGNESGINEPLTDEGVDTTKAKAINDQLKKIGGIIEKVRSYLIL